MSNTFSGCNVLNTVTLPTSMTALTTLSNTFINCWAITSITLPTTISTTATTWANAFQNCYALKTVTLPTSVQNSLTTLTNLFSLCQSLSTINNLSSLTGTSNKDATTGFIGTDSLTSVTFNASFSKLDMYGIVASPTGLTTLRLLGANASQYGGASPQINISYTSLGTAALNQVFTDLPTVTTKTINITGCPGAATCTRSIATTKGWTVTG
jgi:hypothetical protein